MVVKLMPRDIVTRWDAIVYGIDQSLPPYVYRTSNTFSDILHRLLLDDMQCWALTSSPSVEDIDAIATTFVSKDAVTENKALIIYTLYAYNSVTGERWKEGIEALKKYAKGRDCSVLSSYTTNKRVTQISALTGGETHNYLMWRTMDEDL